MVAFIGVMLREPDFTQGLLRTAKGCLQDKAQLPQEEKEISVRTVCKYLHQKL